jgi:hypothetical protein
MRRHRVGQLLRRTRQGTIRLGRWVAYLCLGPLTANTNWRWADRYVIWLAQCGLRAHADTEVLAGLDGRQLAGLLRDSTTRAVILRRPLARTTSAMALLESVTIPELGLVIAAALERHDDGVERSRVVYEAICLPTAATTRMQRETALLVVARTADKLLRDQARQILSHCLKHAAQPTDPYQPEEPRLLERQAATAVLEEHPALDAVVLDRVSPGMWSTDLEILAAAFTARPRGRAEAIAALFGCWQPSSSFARRFAAVIDTSRTTSSRVQSAVVGRDHGQVTARRYATRLSKLFLVPGSVILATFAAWDWRWIDAPLHPAFGEALGALAVIAAIHVVSAQLAATRLDGVVARYSTSSASIVVSYWAALAMVVCTATVHSNRVNEALSWGATVSAVIFALGAVAAAWSLVRQTDPARASRLFAENRVGFYRRSGVSLGRIQARAIEFREESAQLGFVTMDTEPAHMARRAPITSGRRGAHIPNIRRLRRLGSRAMWADGRLQLHVLAMLGVAIPLGMEIGAVVPDVNSIVPPTELGRARRAFRMFSTKRIEAAAEGAVLLVSVTARLARSGDQGGAARVGEALEELLRAHIVEADRVRTARHTAEYPPVVPALAYTLDALVVQIAESETTVDRTILSELLKRIIVLGGKRCSAVVIVANRFTSLDSVLSPIEMASILRVMARVCLATDDLNSLKLVEKDAHTRIDRNGHTVDALLEVAADIPAMAAWLNQPLAAGAWRRYRERVKVLMTSPAGVQYACRVGAANLAAGSISVAVDVTLDLRAAGVDLSRYLAALTSPDRIAREATLAGFSGGYLGHNPEAALREFFEFAIAGMAAIRN